MTNFYAPIQCITQVNLLLCLQNFHCSCFISQNWGQTVYPLW